MNLGNKLAVGEAVDPGIDPAIDLEHDTELDPAAQSAQATIVAVLAREEPVAAHAER